MRRIGLLVAIGTAVAVGASALTGSDNTAPSVALTAPSSGTVSGVVAMQATASDDRSVESVQFKVNGNNEGAPDVSAPYSINWDTTGVSNNNYTLTAAARDPAGNTTVSGGIAVTVSNAGCALPNYPDETCTGVPTGTTLTAYTGPNPVTANGTVIDSKTITSCPFVIEAINVTIRKSEIVCSNETALYVDDAGMYTETSNATVYAVTVEDSLLDCGPLGPSNPTGAVEAHIALYRVEIKRCENGLSINQNFLIEDSLIWKHDNNGTDPHEDGIQLSFGHWTGASYPCCSKNVVIRHNRIVGMAETGAGNFTTSAIIMNPQFDENVLIEENLLIGGGYTIYCTRPTDSVAEGFILRNNHFSTEFFPNVGFLGTDDDCGDENISGNVIHETGDPVNFEDYS